MGYPKCTLCQVFPPLPTQHGPISGCLLSNPKLILIKYQPLPGTVRKGNLLQNHSRIEYESLGASFIYPHHYYSLNTQVL